MKTLCVAIVVLSLTSVCQPASLACEKLLNPEDKSPDLSGRWHVIASSADKCWFPLLVNALFWPSIAMDITAKDTPNIYDANIKFDSHGYCTNKSTPLRYENNTIVLDVDSDNLVTGKSFFLVQTGCPDCLVLKGDHDLKTLTLFSRRKNVTADELKEFEAQAECLGWMKPQMLKSDHDYETCKSFKDITDSDDQAVMSMMDDRVKTMQDDLVKCDPNLSLLPLLLFFLKIKHQLLG
ncbi:uncharacterized protein [Thunnus thynnus]|uniref:uncharacterized protein n=1 Tax=Thunnus thynnus TaxID=8237 RepID=UPI00352899F1